ncbi:MAG TPA: ABC transporter substrate-binding protein [Bryobacteraceae bacterium]|nr:ABC transporter substrate-binding protein [Bryobacteraceae bacterium]
MRRSIVLWLAAAALAPGQRPPQRIVSTAPSITELLYALGLGDRIVGVDRFSRYPPEVLRKQKIGDYANPNLEVIASLRPDLVMIPTNPVKLAERLGTLRLKVLEIDQEGIAKLYDSFRIVGQATGTVEQAAKLTSTVRGQLETVRARAAPLKRTRMMFVVGRTPNRLDGLIVVGQASYLNEIIALAGGENVFRDAVASYPAVSLEEVLSRNPDVIVDMGDMADTVGVTAEHKREVTSLWERLSSVAAVKQHRVYAVASDVYVVPGPRVVEAAKAFFEMLHPDGR